MDPGVFGPDLIASSQDGVGADDNKGNAKRGATPTRLIKELEGMGATEAGDTSEGAEREEES